MLSGMLAMSDPKTKAAGNNSPGGPDPRKRDHENNAQGDSASDLRQKKGSKRLITDLGQLRDTSAYLQRIGAVPMNFRTAKITETVDGYPSIVGRVSFAHDGEATITGEAEAPTENEQEKIRAEFEASIFPEIVALDAIHEPPPGVDLYHENTFICHDFDGRIALIHQRYVTEGGAKGFAPWTHWSDGHWRKMEPDVLPFFGLPGYQMHSVLFLHEGAKSAKRVKEMVAGDRSVDRFPWLEDMRWGYHVGWIGGVNAVEQSDWPKLAKHGWKKVVIVADNDEKGVKAAAKIARKFRCKVRIIRFDDRFDDGFDLGDAFPDPLYNKSGHYTGPEFRDCERPATQATFLLPPEGRGRPSAILRDEFAAEWAYTIQPPFVIRRDRPDRLLAPEEFNALVGPFSDVKDVSSKLLANLSAQHDRMEYDPGQPSGTLAKDGCILWNAYRGSGIKPLEGDPSMWLSFVPLRMNGREP